ncbi:BON domain-containing protein [Mongoliimonas terrestris]|uniref:BON domain-containing protein n=1 Tax=Mongoliimonas terrestris TaxID=1709001 RepID=UPI0009496015|nr:BON domain-containing protein [Mongoliimonas terrestris]
MADWKVQAASIATVAGVLTIGAVAFEGGAIEQSIRDRAAEVLAPEITGWATADIDGRDVALTGVAPSEAARALAEQRVARLFGVRGVDMSSTDLLPEQSPYEVRLVRQNGVLSLEGSAPSGPERARMVDAFTRAVPNLAYNDRLTLARGAPENGFAEALAALYPLLAAFETGAIILSDTTVSVAGEAASNEAYARLQAGLPPLPPGYAVADVAVTRPVASPYIYSAAVDDTGVVVSGFAPDPDTRNRLFGLARTAAGQAPIGDRVDLASGAPDGFAEVAADALDFLPLLVRGRVDIADRRIVVSGTAADPAAWRTLNAHLGAWAPAGYTVEADVGLPVVSPYTLTAVRAGDKVTVSGFVPTDAVLEGLKSTATKVAGLKGAVVEATLADGAPDAFAAAAGFAIQALDHLSAGTASLADRRIVIDGTAESGAELLELRALVASAAPEGFEVALTVVPPKVSPYVWSLEKTADSLVVAGYSPSEEVKTAVREASEAASEDLAVADRSQLASGLSPDIAPEAVAAFAAEQLARLDTGRVVLEDGAITLIGATGDARTAVAVRQAFETALPAGTRPSRIALDAPPALTFTIERGLDAVVLEGTVADAAARDRIAEVVRRAFGTIDVEMSLEEFPGLPADAADAAIAAVRAASLLATGTVDLSGTVLTVQGKAFTGVGATRLSTDVATDLPSGYRLDTSISVARREPPVPAAACQGIIDPLLAANALYFEPGVAAVADDSHGFLDRLAGALLRCEGIRLRIEATGDQPGQGAELGKKRATGVARFLETTGMNLNAIETAGVESLPPTTGPAGAADRRIAITVLPATP